MCQNCCKGCQILTSRYLLGAARGSYRQLPEVPGASAARDLPSTCAGGQDDVSSQVNSLKLAYQWIPMKDYPGATVVGADRNFDGIPDVLQGGF